MEGSVQEKVAANKKYFEQFTTMADFAKYDIQLQLGKPNAWYKGKKIETYALGEQITYLVHYADFQVGGITEEMLEQAVSESTVKENILMSLFIVNIHKTMFTINKGIQTIETTVEDLHKALADVKTSLE
eukprot:8306677-Ditylum_brightwellii.AAC.1